MQTLLVEPLTAAAFAPFGDVIAPDSAKQVYPINAGTCLRYHDVATLDVSDRGGRALVSWCRAQPRALPFVVGLLERHPLGSQAFVPLSDRPYLVVVASAPDARPRAFLARRHGVNYAKGTWHHPLIALEDVSDFLVIDRGGAGDNCDEVALAEPWLVPGPR
jgi:ureidoglycolate lyase